MTENIHIAKELCKEISEKDIDSLFKKIKEFQEENQRYLIKAPVTMPTVKPTIINTTNTNNKNLWQIGIK